MARSEQRTGRRRLRRGRERDPGHPSRSGRVDWWSLLPLHAIAARVAVLGSEDDADAVADVLLATGRCRERTREIDQADVVVVLTTWPGELRELLRWTSRDALLVIEAVRTRRDPAPVLRVERLLRQQACGLMGTWWVTPDVWTPRRFFPLDAPRALRWFLDTHFVAGSRALAAERRALRLLTRLPRWTRAAVASSAVIVATRLPGRPAPPSVVGEALYRAQISPRDDSRSILVTSGNDVGSRCVFYAFATPSARRPAIVVKQSSRPEFNEHTRNEHDRLVRLRRHLGDLDRFVPRPLAVFDRDGLAVSVESVAAGHTLASTAREHGRPLDEQLDELTNVLASVRRAWSRMGLRSAPGSREDWDAAVLGPVLGLRDLLAGRAEPTVLTPGLAAVLDDVERQVRAAPAGVPLLEQHFDIGPWNVYLDGRDVTLIDWETDPVRQPFLCGLPGTDLAYLIQYWWFAHVQADGAADELAALRRLADAVAAVAVGARGATTGGSAADATVERRLAELLAREVGALGGRDDLAPLALLLMWCERAWYQVLRATRTGGGAGGGAGTAPTAAPPMLRWLEEVGPTLLAASAPPAERAAG